MLGMSAQIVIVDIKSLATKITLIDDNDRWHSSMIYLMFKHTLHATNLCQDEVIYPCFHVQSPGPQLTQQDIGFQRSFSSESEQTFECWPAACR